METNLPSDLISTKEAGDLVGVRPAVIVGWIRAGMLPGWKVGRKVYRVSRADVLAWVASAQGAGPEQSPQPPAMRVTTGRRRTPGFYLACNQLLLSGTMTREDYQRFYK